MTCAHEHGEYYDEATQRGIPCRIQSSDLERHAIKRSHLAEILAAMLGYQNYAALVVEEGDGSLDHHLDDAHMLVLNQPAAMRRAESLGLGAIPGLIQACLSAVQSSGPMPVHENLGQFYD
jgi:hypothetical protein